MASFLLSECLEKILSNFIGEHTFSDISSNVFTKDLYSCSLVSRHWCRISTPFLYSYPFHHFRHKTSYNSFYKLIRTLLSCVPQSEIKQLKTNSSSTFNYVSLIRGLIVDELMFSNCDVSTICTAKILNLLLKLLKQVNGKMLRVF